MGESVLPQLLVNGILLGGIYSLMAIGLTLTFGVTGITNFAHADYIMLGMYTTFWSYTYFGINPYLSVPIVAIIMFCLGAFVYRTIIARLWMLNSPLYMMIFATVGVSITMQNTALALWTADFRTVPYLRRVVWEVLGLRISVPRLVGFLVAFALTIALFMFLKHTFTGRAIRATSQDKIAAGLMGIDINRMYLYAFGIGAACAGVAGSIITPIYYTFPSVGQLFALTAFIVVVLGGLGSMTGALIAGLIIGIVDSLAGYYVSPAFKESIYFVIFVAILIFRPSGLFGVPKAR